MFSWGKKKYLHNDKFKNIHYLIFIQTRFFKSYVDAILPIWKAYNHIEVVRTAIREFADYFKLLLQIAENSLNLGDHYSVYEKDHYVNYYFKVLKCLK